MSPSAVVPPEAQARLWQLPHARYEPPNALRLDLTRDDDLKALYRQQYLVDPELHTRPARRPYAPRTQADLFGLHARHPSVYGPNDTADPVVPLTGRARVAQRGPAAEVHDGMSFARFVLGSAATPSHDRDAVAHPRRHTPQRAGLYASNVNHVNLFDWASDGVVAEPVVVRPGRDHLQHNMIPKSDTHGTKTRSVTDPWRGRTVVRGRAAIGVQFAAQPENAMRERRGSARVTAAMQTLSARMDHDIFGVTERNARRAAGSSSQPNGDNKTSDYRTAPYGAEDEIVGNGTVSGPQPRRSSEPFGDVLTRPHTGIRVVTSGV